MKIISVEINSTLWGDENVQKLIVVMSAQLSDYTKKPQNRTLSISEWYGV